MSEAGTHLGNLCSARKHAPCPSLRGPKIFQRERLRSYNSTLQLSGDFPSGMVAGKRKPRISMMQLHNHIPQIRRRKTSEIARPHRDSFA
ncbi:uncharacterized protein FPRO_14875 [Fusarium proliferatum ET1]|uniref:Uncharacterized protein n=1 Tax=Fusarium proliferatum (strain ET1) TaxID=1227346 RepID=A0A1L7WAK9_FUSPR|nr:uncharacterized protein FPRO_14875 [Fusarium proliferatum ET1]CZR49646.1 uncharacterized protein FPRO_14875 [Fusarium proliferatum ET1]